ncbi:hotdog fold domain-containing protein [Litoribacillus peritrichatus]|uniref:Hotdog fold domain-containing protein n=1 Tax=Litoribacillus peritrichatus TaxID=718191 RepID=A0ABP7MSM6_9GAMM
MDALKLFNKFKSVPQGTKLFSKAVCVIAPYFGSIKPHMTELRPGYCEVKMKNRRSVQNHLKTVHAIAMCNMAELAGGTMTDVSIPKGSRWIPAEMTVKYVKKAKTDLVAIADGSNVDWHTQGNVVVPVVIKDTHGEVVFTADISMNLKH